MKEREDSDEEFTDAIDGHGELPILASWKYWTNRYLQ